MAEKSKPPDCCTADNLTGSCRIEALVSVDERGQMVLPKETRDRAKIQAGDKLALISGEKDGKVCCLLLIRAAELTGIVKGMLGPVFQEIMR